MAEKKKKWMASAFKESRKGALHRALGVPEEENIPASKVAAAAKAGGKLGRMARLAKIGAKISRRK